MLNRVVAATVSSTTAAPRPRRRGWPPITSTPWPASTASTPGRATASGAKPSPAADSKVKASGAPTTPNDRRRRDVADGFEYSLRNCIEKRHDQLLLELNRRYWQATVGS